MENLKTYLEFIKFKITLFSTIIGAGIFLLMNKSVLNSYFNENFSKYIILVIVVYGLFGFLINVFEYNKRVKEFKDEYIWLYFSC